MDQPLTLEKAVAVAAELGARRPEEGFRILSHGFYLARCRAEVDPVRGERVMEAWCESLLRYAMEHGMRVDADLS